MYQIKNGILRQDGKPLFGLGQSYYPSFHHAKYPVPPDGDRIGQMKQDLAMMARMGFNHVRFAALGLTKLDENGALVVDTPFVDAMIRESETLNISVSVRLQGYAVNLRQFQDVAMVDQYGTPQDLTVWYDFIQTGFHHPGLLEDNRIHSAGLSRHFSRFPNVVAYQIYNEPHFPGKTFFDYHPVTVAAFRRWLEEKGVMTAAEAAGYEPPRSRAEQDGRMWALWRLFSRDSLTAFLDNASDASKAAVGLPTYTCFTAAPISRGNAYHGCDLFVNARSMDLVGYTCYLHATGADHYAMELLGDTAQCAAELEGKQAWCIELDSRTCISPSLFNRNTYTTLGSGIKGIVYYQWRGDYPVPGVPHPNSCGLLNYDGTKTANYDNAARTVAFIRQHNDLLVNTRHCHQGIGLLHSDYANFLCDARENTDQKRLEDVHNSHLLEYTATYRALREAGFAVTVTDAGHLDRDPLGIRVLYVVHPQDLSEEEQAALDRFTARGGRVFELNYSYDRSCAMGFREYVKEPKPYEVRIYDPLYTVQDVADLTGIQPLAIPVGPGLSVQVLEGDGQYVLVLTNLSTQRRSLDAVLQLNLPAKAAVCYAIDGPKNCTLTSRLLTVKDLTDGALVVLEM